MDRFDSARRSDAEVQNDSALDARGLGGGRVDRRTHVIKMLLDRPYINLDNLLCLGCGKTAQAKKHYC